MQPLEYKPKIYKPEDIRFRDEEPYLEILLGQMALELVLKNVGSATEPIWIAWFDPREKEVQEAGTKALVEMLNEIKDISLALTPYSSKSGPMIKEACGLLNLPLLTLQGSYDKNKLKQDHNSQHIYVYHPITSLSNPKYMAFGKETRDYVLSVLRMGKKLVIIDDVYSSGNTVKTILLGLKDILGEELYDNAQIEVVTVAREGVIKNNEQISEIDLDKSLTFDVYIPEIIGDLNKAIEE